MPQSATETRPTTSELWEAWNMATRRRDIAANCLAFDVTVRAEEPYVGQHQRPSTELTAQLKADYRSACAAVNAAFAAWLTRVEARS